MARKERIVKYSDEAIRAMIAGGESLSDWARAEATTHDDVEADIASDSDESGMEVDWSKAAVNIPEPKAVLNMRVDRDFFRREGKGHQTKINAVLRSYVDQMRRQAGG